MKKTQLLCAGALILAGAHISLASTPETHDAEPATDNATEIAEESAEEPQVIHRLTETDYQEVAEKLGVEVAAIKAVVDIEAGRAHEGFFKPGKPIINFDVSMFRKFAGRKGIALSRYMRTHSEVFSSPNARRHGSTQVAQHVRLAKARTIDENTAIEGTFWGMFQLGGFNWKRCGCANIEEFVEKMSRSERDQLDLFAEFITSTGLLKHLKAKNWSAFARGYNGTSYAKRGYHTRMASAYARHKAKESKEPKEEKAPAEPQS
ncbi:MAG: N-acetylmuramidase family protein [Muribaculaceae bacterium]|nr:N-acetylmuramidase family protein [Muribaculaceae bacterium]